MKHKDMKAYLLKQANKQYTDGLVARALETQFTCLLVILHDKFGFGAKRLEDVMTYLAKESTSHKIDLDAGILTTSDDFKQILLDECGLDFDKIAKNLYEKSMSKEIFEKK